MRRFLGCTLTCLFAATLSVGSSVAQDAGISARHHAWGRFQPGAWKLVRVVTETFDDRGALASTNLTETKTTLRKVDGDGVTLEIEVAMEVAGKQFDAQPQCIRQGFHGELLDPNLIVKTPTGGQLKIDDKNIICRVQQLDICAGGNKTAVTVYYSDTVSPYILKRESVTTGADEKVLGETTMNVVSLDVPYKVLAETKRVARLKTVQRHTKGVVTTEAMTSPDVPGGIVHTTSKETDANGRLTRQSVLELVSFGLKGEEERTGLFGRKRPARMRKSATNSASW
jgi:hypothetical protein